MNQNEKFNNILSECLDRILKGETIEQCLGSYPGQVKELEPLLRTVLAARIASKIQPRAEFRAKARYEFQSAMRAMAAKESQRRPLFSLHWQWHSGWAIAIIAIIIVVLAGGGTMAAADNSMPDSTLYSVKLATEEFQLALTSSDLDKTELNARFASRRADEIVYLASKGDVDHVNVTAERLSNNLESMTELAGNESGNMATIDDGSILSSDGPLNESPQVATPLPDSEEPASTLTSTIASSPTFEPPSTNDTKPSADINTPGSLEQAKSKVGEIPDEQEPERVSGKALAPKLERLRKILTENFEKRQNRLEEALKTAPPNVREALRLTIIKSKAEYDKAIQNLTNSPPSRN